MKFTAIPQFNCRILYFFINGKPCEAHPDLKEPLTIESSIEIEMPDTVKTMIAIVELPSGAHCPMALIPVGMCEHNHATVVHWIRSTPITKSAEERGLVCGTPLLEGMQASSYREQVTCELCLNPSQKS